MQPDNLARWDGLRDGFYEVWYLKLNLPSNSAEPGPALWLRLTTLSLKTGLKKVAETWAVFFEPDSKAGTRKLAIKNTAGLAAYQSRSEGGVQIEDSVFLPGRTSGSAAGRGHRVEWDLAFEPNTFSFHHVPAVLQKMRLTKSIVCKPNIDVKFKGHFSVNGRRFEVNGAPGCQGHIWGKRYAHDWAWAHCNLFENGAGAVIELLSARVKLGGLLTSPRLSALYFDYKGERHEFNKLRDSLAIKSNYSLTRWDFVADRGPLRLIGEITCDSKDLVGVTYEDTQGSFLYCNNSGLASLTLSVYHRGKLDGTLKSSRTTSFETVSRNRSPYVEVLL
jgi:hypothetical protein